MVNWKISLKREECEQCKGIGSIQIGCMATPCQKCKGTGKQNNGGKA